MLTSDPRVTCAERVVIRALVEHRDVLTMDAGRGGTFASSVLAGFACPVNALIGG